MRLDYEKNFETVRRRLITAHNPGIAKIRCKMISAEYKFYRRNIEDKKVLVAGSGLGHDCMELAMYNDRVFGVEIVPAFIEESKKNLENFSNVTIYQKDMRELPSLFRERAFDVAVLGMGTICGLHDKELIIQGMSKVAKKVYIDFYHGYDIESWMKMYKQEGWKGVKAIDGIVTSDDGLYAKSFTPDEFKSLTRGRIPGKDIGVWTLSSLMDMAVIK